MVYMEKISKLKSDKSKFKQKAKQADKRLKEAEMELS
jgi:hypothetical protein